MGPTAPSIRAARAAAAADGDARPPRCCWRVAAADSFARWGRWSYGRCVRLHGGADMVSCDHHTRPRMSHDTYNQGLRRFWRRSVQRGGSNNAESRVLGSRRCCEPGDEGTIRMGTWLCQRPPSRPGAGSSHEMERMHHLADTSLSEEPALRCLPGCHGACQPRLKYRTSTGYSTGYFVDG